LNVCGLYGIIEAYETSTAARGGDIMQSENRVAIGLRFIGIAFIVVAIISAVTIIPDDATSGILIAMGTAAGGLVLMGLGEIIRILERRTSDAA
jgi:hypothetical protein